MNLGSSRSFGNRSKSDQKELQCLESILVLDCCDFKFTSVFCAATFNFNLLCVCKTVFPPLLIVPKFSVVKKRKVTNGNIFFFSEAVKEEHLDFRQSELLQGFTYFLYPILSVN